MHIYAITNTVNLKIYIGQHKGNNLQSYLKSKFRQAVKHSKTQPVLFAAMRKYGESAFTITSLARPINKEQMDGLERFFIRTLNSQDKEIGYNIHAGGGVGAHGVKFSEEHKRKLSEAHRGRKFSEEHRRNLSEARKNLSDEARANASAAQRGKKMLPQTKVAIRNGFENMSKESRQRMNTAYLKVDHSNRSPDHCRKISEGLKGKHPTEETRAKLSAAKLGKKLPDSHRNAIRQALMERTTPEERSLAAKRRNEIRWGHTKT